MNTQIGKNGMKRIILPLLAALALPTAVNAETIYLKCDINEQEDIVYKFAINEENSTVQVSVPMARGYYKSIKGSLFVSSDSFAAKVVDSGGSFTRYEINRLDGSYEMHMGSWKYPEDIPEQKVATGTCSKEEKQKTLF